ncbi:hypothetical protein HYT84_00275 [Candidatus Micrarchaeota archaeon]|nr:hypothetical protein [Candidatus Micrarchaeota archaeon]
MLKQQKLEGLRIRPRRAHGFGKERDLANGPTGRNERKQLINLVRGFIAAEDFEGLVSLLKANRDLTLSARKQIGERLLDYYRENCFVHGDRSDLKAMLRLSNAIKRLIKKIPELKSEWWVSCVTEPDEEMSMVKAIGEGKLADFYVQIYSKEMENSRAHVAAFLKRRAGFDLGEEKLPQKVGEVAELEKENTVVTITLRDFTSAIGMVNWTSGSEHSLMYEVRVSQKEPLNL